MMEDFLTFFFFITLTDQGVGSAVNKLNDLIAMIAEVRSIADALGLPITYVSEEQRTAYY